MRAVIIGGTGHIGSYLTPRLVEAGLSIVNVSRSQRQPYRPHPAWREIRQVDLDRAAEEKSGTFGEKIAQLEPDVVIDLTCYLLESAQLLVEALRGRVTHFLHCGTIWVHGLAVETPATEEQPREPLEEYGCRKAAIEAYLLKEARRNRFPATILHPGHLVGVGWTPINPVGNFNPTVFSDLARSEEVTLPNLGRECLHHVHVDDVAQAFPGESCPITWGHIAHSSNCSIQKARRLLGYQPCYTSLEAIRESVYDQLAGQCTMGNPATGARK
jgi:nucleoside-diphosphate-sugar epimerase